MNSEQDFEKTYSSLNAGVYRTFFRHVEHENALGNARFGLMAQIQSLLLIAYATTLNGLLSFYGTNANVSRSFWVLLGVHAMQILLPVIGIVSAVTARQSISAAYTAFMRYQEQFEGLYGVRRELSLWPALGGASVFDLREKGWAYLRIAPIFLICMWLIILAGSIGLQYRLFY